MRSLHQLASALPLLGVAQSLAVAQNLAVRQLSPPPGSKDPQYVKVVGISVLGSGCPKDSADVQIDATGTLFEVTFSEYEVQTGPDTHPADWRKNCKLTINMEFTPGYQ